MGLFDFFLSEEQKIQRNTRKLTNRDSTPEDREAAARWLAENGSPKALIGLLARFDMNLEHQLKDSGEKDFVLSLLIGQGPKAIEVSQSWLRQCKQVAVPLRLLGELAGPDVQFKTVLDLLEVERQRDDFKADKKKALLVWMADVRRPECITAARPFLADFDEGVRYAAAEVIIAQPGDAGREALASVLESQREESNRLKIRIAEVFAQRRWSVDEHVAERLPPGFRVRDGRVATA